MTLPPPFGPHAFDNLKSYLSGLLSTLPERPKAILVVSGHWEEDRALLRNGSGDSLRESRCVDGADAQASCTEISNDELERI